MRVFFSDFGSMFTCHPFKPNDQKLVTNNGADAVKLCNDMGGFWSYGVPEAFPGCGGCFCCKQGKLGECEEGFNINLSQNLS